MRVEIANCKYLTRRHDLMLMFVKASTVVAFVITVPTLGGWQVDSFAIGVAMGFAAGALAMLVWVFLVAQATQPGPRSQ